MLQLTLYSIPGIATVVLGLALLPFVWRHRAAPGGWPLAVLIVAISWWGLGQIASTMATTLDGKFMAARMQYPGIVVAPTAWFMFCLRYSNTLPRLYGNWLVLLPIPLVTLVLALSNDLHHWLWADARLVRVQDFIAWEIDYGPWFAISRWWSYLLTGVGTLALLASLMASPWHRRRALLVVIAPLFVLAANLLYLAPDSPMAWLDLTPVGFVLAGAVFAFALRGDLLDLVPLSREQVLQDMQDAVFVVATDGRVIDMNPAAATLVARCAHAQTGRPLWDLLPIPRMTLERELGTSRPLDVVMHIAGQESAWRISASELRDPRGAESGRVLIFHDTTDRWRAERELRATSEALAAANRELTRLITLDPLTRTLQRGAFLRQAQEEVVRTRRSSRDLAMLTLRLTNLAELNAQAGSDVADQVLRALARLMESMRRDGDLLGRTGASEFSLLLTETSKAQAASCAEDLRAAVARSRFRDGAGQALTLGVRQVLVHLDATMSDADTLLGRASAEAEGTRQALYDPDPA